jgi:hypothetical protein
MSAANLTTLENRDRVVIVTNSTKRKEAGGHITLMGS